METCCDFCAYNEYDEDDEEYYCSVNMDEDLSLIHISEPTRH